MKAELTMQSVADLACVSLMTVSRSLKNDPSISLQTRTRIQKIADELGYKRDPLMTALTHQTKLTRMKKSIATLAFVTGYPSSTAGQSRFFAGATERCAELGYVLEHFCFTAPGLKDDRVDRIFNSRFIRGLIFDALPDSRPKLKLSWDRYAHGSDWLHHETARLAPGCQ